MKRVIFLDVDGVLIPGGRGRTAAPQCVAALNSITEATGAELVLSSTWRIHGLTWLRETLRNWGVTAPLVALTPVLRSYLGNPVIVSPRGTEIQAWLNSVAAPVSMVILDDDADMLHLLPWLVKCKTATGLTPELAQRAIRLLEHGPEI